jgi:hypothetical protein
MKLDFKKIINIKSKDDLNKYKLNEPIFHDNYLFHYLIIYNKLDILKMHRFPIYKENDEGLNGFHIAAKYGFYDILFYLIDTYPEYIYNKNSDDLVFMDFIDYKNINKFIDLKLDWQRLLEKKINDLLFNLNYKQLIDLFKIYKPNKIPLHSIVENEHLTGNEIIKILDLFPNELNIRNKDDFSLVFSALYKKDLLILKYLLTKNIDSDYFTIIHTLHPLRTSLHIDWMEAYDLIWNHIKKNFNYELTNKNLDNIVHFLLENDAHDKTSIEILKNSPSAAWNQFNINKISPLELVSELNFNIYSQFLKDKQVNLDVLNLRNKIKNDVWLKFLESLPKYIIDNSVILEKNTYSHTNAFQATFKDMSFYILHLKEKYKNLYCPNLDDYKLRNLTNNDDLDMNWPDETLEKNPILPWIVCYTDEDEYWIHIELNNLINAQRRKKQFDLGFCYLSIRSPDGGLHANILIYDFNQLTIERFDPYGDSVNYDKDIDNILEEELTWNTGLTYLKPSDYLPVAGFQTISDELDPLEQKPGDFGGYCLAWCTWYLEHRLKNIHIKPKELVTKLIRKLSLDNHTFMENIRNYANKLNAYKTKYLLEAGVEPDDVSNLNFSTNLERQIYKYIFGKFT